MEIEPEKKGRESRKRGRPKKHLRELVDTTSSKAESQEEMLPCLSDALQAIILPGVTPPIKEC